MTEAQIEQALSKAHRERPALPAPDAALVMRVRRTLKAATGRSSSSLSWGDLLLAEGCAKGNPQALAELESKVLPEVRRAIAKIDSSSAFVDEAVQAVRERLLAPSDGKEPRIRQYTGEGALTSWARVAGTRVALNLRRSKGQQPAEPVEQLADPLPAASPELALMREHLAGKFEVALCDALAGLSAPDRNLLRLHLIDGVSLEKLGTMLGAHKSTLSRRLQKLEAELISGAREALRRRFGIRARELASAMKIFSTRVNVDVKRLLEGSGP